MKDHRTFLRVKIKSLAAEAAIIRHEERRKTALRNSLVYHRREVVRPAARSAHLAYGFICGKTYREIEPKNYSWPNCQDITRLVKQYGIQWESASLQDYQAAKTDEASRLAEWLKESSKVSQTNTLAA